MPPVKSNPPVKAVFRSLNREVLPLASVRNGQDANLEIRTIKGVEYLYAIIQTPGRPTAAVLAEQLPSLILNLDFPKKMRWGDLDIAFARPIHWIISLFGEHIVPFTVGNITSGRQSMGHRQLAHAAFDLVKANDYVKTLKDHKVMVDIAERKKSIETKVEIKSSMVKLLAAKLSSASPAFG